ncbi:hypothetical protein GPECTOR_20g480 [Gonium pectorale]|uniref:Uncharacterized protein n=1 Tax=Gonium pectorale TaxID=33097 RepID=A0A150GII8_GONPE|nr:hypothetical protein GPECTOR_20g480 [Gonium pectorale]|eukprot:KXZ49623.1 hypothetical protein GPECTOR_20g480 [Gonium pectorale]
MADVPSDVTGRVFPQLPVELTELIVRSLHPNEAATSFRLVNKAAATQFRGPDHTTVRLSQPVPPHAFAAHWLAPGATRGLNLYHRKLLLRLTAASGIVANLEVAVQAVGFDLARDICGLAKSAASAGSLESCRWLKERWCQNSEQLHWYGITSSILNASARAGHRHVCEWLLGAEVLPEQWAASLTREAALAAARGGLSDLADWLLERLKRGVGVAESERSEAEVVEWRSIHVSFLAPTAEGCDLAALQRLFRRCGLGQLPGAVWTKTEILDAAAGSRTPDWAAKVEWLEAQGCLPSSIAVGATAGLPDDGEALARLTWLQGRGYPLAQRSMLTAAGAGNVATLQHVVHNLAAQLGVAAFQECLQCAAEAAARGGHLAALQVLWSARGEAKWRQASLAAAGRGHLHVLAWLIETVRARAVRLDGKLFRWAASSGSVELMAWLRERGCVWGDKALVAAAESGCEEAVEWLVERGCPLSGAYQAYEAASRNGDQAMLRCLRRLDLASE